LKSNSIRFSIHCEAIRASRVFSKKSSPRNDEPPQFLRRAKVAQRF
jgi:hypothetical protein